MKNLLFIFVLTVLLSACTNEDIENTSTPICFTTIETRASGAKWDKDDLIGLFMKHPDTSLSEGSIIGQATNICYRTPDGDGNFMPKNTAIYFPEDKSAVDFIAYYPYKELTSPFSYSLDISDQSVPENIDFMYADNLRNILPQPNALGLQFKHILSRLVIKTTAKSGLLYPIKMTLKQIPVKAQIALSDASITTEHETLKDVTLKTALSGSRAQSSALILPTAEPTALTIVIEYNNKTYTKELPSYILEGGKTYEYTLSLEGFTPDINYRNWRETPLITPDMLADDNLMYVIHEMPNMTDTWTNGKLRNYSLLYDKDLKFAYWVAYPLFKDCIGSSGRTDAWNYDPAIPSAFQANLSSGFGNQYDRGHQIPSGDRTCDKETNRSTFYYSNMTPQVGVKLNQYIWNQLESKVRTWVNDTDTVFVVTGAMPPATGTIERQKGMAVPAYYFKALARKRNGDTGYTTIAFKLENRNYTNTDYMQSAMSVKELEDLTGFVFFPTIDNSIKAILDKSMWN